MDPTENELPRREREQLLHKQQIMDVAMRLFSVKGFHTVSMQEIATEAEFAIGTLYKFFASKEALYHEIMERNANRIMDIISPIIDGVADEREKIARMIRSTIDIFRNSASAIRLFLYANQQRPGLGDCMPPSENAAKFHQNLLEALERVISSGISKGLFRNIDPYVGALALDATIRALVFSAAQTSQEGLLERRVADFEQLLFNGILISRENNHA